MATVQQVKEYIDQLCRQIGTTADAVFNPKTGAWYFAMGSSTVEVFLTSYEMPGHGARNYLRCFAPLHMIPGDNAQKLDFFQGALEVNTEYMGIKLGSIAQRNLLCAIAERDIDRMDYTEMVTMISDIGYWADKLDDYLKKNFS
jgi:hypothetical protein